LLQVSEDVATAAQDADLIILEGMGRSIETNLNARLSVDALKLGMIKHRCTLQHADCKALADAPLSVAKMVQCPVHL
jgi:hypothetical protein